MTNKEDMIKWINNHPIWSLSQLPNWLLDLGKDHEDIEDPTEFYRDLMAVAHLRRLADKEGWLSLDLEDLKEELVIFLNNLDFIMDIERMRRKGNFCQMEVLDVFGLDYETGVVITRIDLSETSVTFEDILSEFSEVNNDKEDTDENFEK